MFSHHAYILEWSDSLYFAVIVEETVKLSASSAFVISDGYEGTSVMVSSRAYLFHAWGRTGLRALLGRLLCGELGDSASRELPYISVSFVFGVGCLRG